MKKLIILILLVFCFTIQASQMLVITDIHHTDRPSTDGPTSGPGTPAGYERWPYIGLARIGDFNQVALQNSIDFAAQIGDLADSNSDDNAAVHLEAITAFSDDLSTLLDVGFFGEKRFLQVDGNHENSSVPADSISDSDFNSNVVTFNVTTDSSIEWLTAAFSSLHFWPLSPQGNEFSRLRSYYNDVDIDSTTYRIINLSILAASSLDCEQGYPNTKTTPNNFWGNQVNNNMLHWLEDTALNTTDPIMVFAHAPLGSEEIRFTLGITKEVTMASGAAVDAGTTVIGDSTVRLATLPTATNIFSVGDAVNITMNVGSGYYHDKWFYVHARTNTTITIQYKADDVFQSENFTTSDTVRRATVFDIHDILGAKQTADGNIVGVFSGHWHTYKTIHPSGNLETIGDVEYYQLGGAILAVEGSNGTIDNNVFYLFDFDENGINRVTNWRLSDLRRRYQFNIIDETFDRIRPRIGR
jgi:hypothetical protein